MTSAGSEVVVEVNRLRREIAQGFFSELSEAEAATVVEILGKALDHENLN